MAEAPKWDEGPWIAIPASVRLGGVHDEKPLFDDGLWAILPESNMERLPICTVDRGNDHHAPTREKAKHIARLVAAAPTLYDTLARTRTRMARYGESVAELDEIDAALAKARGEATDAS